jgi:hypothetical protein
MGTQQILLIVLSVIIVGVAIAVGITMFNNQAYNNNQQAVAAELQNYATQAIQFYKTPVSQGGAGQDSTKVTVSSLSAFLGFTSPSVRVMMSSSMITDNGEYRIMAVTGNTVMLQGMGVETKAGKHPLIYTNVELNTGNITSTVSSGTEFNT